MATDAKYRRSFDTSFLRQPVTQRIDGAETVEQWMARTGEAPEILPPGLSNDTDGNAIDARLYVDDAPLPAIVTVDE